MRTLSVLSFLMLVGCAARRDSAYFAEQRVEAGFDHDAVHMTGNLWHDGDGWKGSSYAYDDGGPEVVRAVAGRLEACGQAPGDVLDVRVHARQGEWPWSVDVLDATPGAEDCVADVLATLPIDPETGGHAERYLALRTTTAALKAPRTHPEVYDCALERRGSMPDSELAYYMQQAHMDLDDPGAVAFAVTCAADVPLTELSLHYEGPTLVEVRTAPHVPCVEEAARRLAHPSDLGGPNRVRNPGSFSQDPADWDEMVCRVSVPLRPM